MERTHRQTFFVDRVQAGRNLACQLSHLKEMQPVALALPRGGVVVGYEVAAALHAPLDIVAVRKIEAPFHPELGIGALVDGDEPELFLDSERTRMFAANAEGLRTQVEAEFSEIQRRERLYRGGEPRIDVHGRTVIVVDDGIATGSSMHAVLRGLRRSFGLHSPWQACGESVHRKLQREASRRALERGTVPLDRRWSKEVAGVET
jgi:putative phosphoribosyl transferase